MKAVSSPIRPAVCRPGSAVPRHGRGAQLRAAAALLAFLSYVWGIPSSSASPQPLGCEDSSYVDETGHCNPLHPGDAVGFPGFYCTLNFLWVDSRGNRYFGTAGHCTVGSRVGAVATDGQSRAIGKLVYSVWDPTNDAVDLALIRLDPHVEALPTLRHWGGPKGAFTGYTANPSALCFFGQADGLAVAAAPRNLVATAITQPDIALVSGAISFGDSGAPVIDAQGRALGWVESIADSYHTPASLAYGGAEVGEEVVTRIGPAIVKADRALHAKLRLVPGAQSSCAFSNSKLTPQKPLARTRA